MQMMNQYGNQQRGFGGAPQPQRQGGRRGNRGGGAPFRGNSRFEHNQPRNQNAPNAGPQGGQRPNVSPQSAAKPQLQTKPPGPQTPAPVAQKQEAPTQQAQPKPVQALIKPDAKDTVDKAKPVVEQKNQNQGAALNQNQQQQKNVNGNFAASTNQGDFAGGQKKPDFGAANKSGDFTAAQNKPGGFGGGNKPGDFASAQNKPGGFGGTNKPADFAGAQNKTGGFGGANKPADFAGAQNKAGGFGGGNKQGSFNEGNKQGGFGGGNKQGGFSVGNKPVDFGEGNKPGNFGGFNKQFGGPNKQGDFSGGNSQGDFEAGGDKQGDFGGFNKQGGGWAQGGNRQGNKPFNKQGGGGSVQGGPGGRNQRGGRPPHMQDGFQREEHMLANKLKDLMGPLIDLHPIDQSEVKFNGRSRLYIGNLTNDVTEEEILSMFGAFGESSELFLNKEKNFGFIKMDYRVNAEKAKRELDGKTRNNRTLRVRFAPHNSAVRVKNLPPFVSNELLYRAFEIFGKIERAYVKVDERGKSLGEGVVEFVRKPSALAAIRNCTEKCFFLTSSLRPVIVESFEEPDELDGFPEKNLPKKHPEFLRAREIGPRFSELNSFEHEYGTRWKQLHELHHQKEEALKKELASEEEKLEAQMEYAKYEHETELLREQLRQREQDRERQKRTWEMAERAAEERRDAERTALLRQEEELATRMRHQDDELRRRQQENTLFVQAQRLNNMLDRQEQGMFDQQSPMDGGFREQFDRTRGSYEDLQQPGRGWEGPRQMDDFPNKRRRF